MIRRVGLFPRHGTATFIPAAADETLEQQATTAPEEAGELRNPPDRQTPGPGIPSAGDRKLGHSSPRLVKFLQQ